MSVKERFRREKVGLGVFMQVQDTCKLVPCARSRGDWLDDHDQHHTAFLWCYRNQLPRWPTSEQHRFLVVRLFPRYRFQRNTKGVVRYASLLSADPPLLHAGGRSAKQTTLLHSSTSETTAPPGHSLDKWTTNLRTPMETVMILRETATPQALANRSPTHGQTSL